MNIVVEELIPWLEMRKEDAKQQLSRSMGALTPSGSNTLSRCENIVILTVRVNELDAVIAKVQSLR